MALATVLGAPVATEMAAGLSAGSGAGVLAGLMKHPLWSAVLSQIGGNLLGNILGPELPYGDYSREQLQAVNAMLPDLSRAAQGAPTAASKAITEQVKSETNRAQQAYAAGARRAGTVGGLPGGTAPYRAQQGRAQVAGQQALSQRLGQAQMAAQQTLASLSPTAMQHTGIQEKTQRDAMNEFMGAMAEFNRGFVGNEYDPQFQEMMSFLKQYLFESLQPSDRRYIGSAWGGQ